MCLYAGLSKSVKLIFLFRPKMYAESARIYTDTHTRAAGISVYKYGQRRRQWPIFIEAYSALKRPNNISPIRSLALANLPRANRRFNFPRTLGQANIGSRDCCCYFFTSSVHARISGNRRALSRWTGRSREGE